MNPSDIPTISIYKNEKGRLESSIFVVSVKDQSIKDKYIREYFQ